MRDKEEFSQSEQVLSDEIQALSEQLDNEESAQQWRFKRRELAEVKYDLFILLEKETPKVAVLKLYESIELGYEKSRDRLYAVKMAPKASPIFSSESDNNDNSNLSNQEFFLLGLQYLIGIGKEVDHSQAFHCFEQAAEQGDARAQSYLGWMYQFGRGVGKDLGLAVEWTTKAAEQGDARAQCSMGVMYGEGLGVPQDFALAVKWATQAAEQGDARAHGNLGVMYQYGRGVGKDLGLAVEWTTKAAEQGDAGAQNNLGWMYGKGLGVPQDFALALEWTTQAAEQGHGGAQRNLGVMYQLARGVEKDGALAIYWYRQATTPRRNNRLFIDYIEIFVSAALFSEQLGSTTSDQLRYLSSFDEEQIPKLADALIFKKAITSSVKDQSIWIAKRRRAGLNFQLVMAVNQVKDKKELQLQHSGALYMLASVFLITNPSKIISKDVWPIIFSFVFDAEISRKEAETLALLTGKSILIKSLQKYSGFFKLNTHSKRAQCFADAVEKINNRNELCDRVKLEADELEQLSEDPLYDEYHAILYRWGNRFFSKKDTVPYPILEKHQENSICTIC